MKYRDRAPEIFPAAVLFPVTVREKGGSGRHVMIDSDEHMLIGVIYCTCIISFLPELCGPQVILCKPDSIPYRSTITMQNLIYIRCHD